MHGEETDEAQVQDKKKPGNDTGPREDDVNDKDERK
jgi:hypothetical protein